MTTTSVGITLTVAGVLGALLLLWSSFSVSEEMGFALMCGAVVAVVIGFILIGIGAME